MAWDVGLVLGGAGAVPVERFHGFRRNRRYRCFCSGVVDCCLILHMNSTQRNSFPLYFIHTELQARVPRTVTVSDTRSIVSSMTEEEVQSKYEPFETVWECNMITEHGSSDSRAYKWHCGFCDKYFHQRNHTKGLAHLLQIGGNSIAKCTGCIPKNYYDNFQRLWDEKVERKEQKKRIHASMRHRIDRDAGAHAEEMLGRNTRRRTGSVMSSAYSASSAASSYASPEKRTTIRPPTMKETGEWPH